SPWLRVLYALVVSGRDITRFCTRPPFARVFSVPPGRRRGGQLACGGEGGRRIVSSQGTGPGLRHLQQRRVPWRRNFKPHHCLADFAPWVAERLYRDGNAWLCMAGRVVALCPHSGACAASPAAGPCWRTAYHAVRAVFHALQSLHGPGMVLLCILVSQV